MMSLSVTGAIARVSATTSDDELSELLSAIYVEFVESSIETQEALGRGLIQLAGNSNHRMQATGVRWLAKVHLRRSKVKEALEHFFQALNLYYLTNTFSSVVACQLEIGVIYQDLGDFSDALSIFEESLEIAKTHGIDGGRLASLIYLSQTHRHLKNWNFAFDYANQAIALAREMGRTRAEGGALMALASAIIEEKNEPITAKDFRLALGHLELALTYLIRADDQATLSEAYIIQSKIMCGLEDFMAAEASVQQGMVHAMRYGSLEALGECELQFGRVFALQRQFEAALRHLLQAKTHFEVNTAKKYLSDVHKEFYKVFKARSEFELALQHFELFYKFDSLVRSERAERQSQALAVKIERENVRREAIWYQQRSEELMRLNEQLDRQASQDALTGLANRRILESFVARVFLEAKEARSKLSVVLLDIDDFKLVNDKFLHASGDLVLQRIAKILSEQCRSHDLVARYGGEEFALVLPGIGGLAVYRLCERIRDVIERTDMTDIHPDLSVTISLGWCDDVSVAHQDKLFEIADRALYSAKNAGRNCTRPQLKD
jgi:diguanylate cyclase (GGDEF)-like protein